VSKSKSKMANGYRGRTPKRARSHLWIVLGKGRLSGTKYCANCGLVMLRNEATRKAIKAPCTGMVDE